MIFGLLSCIRNVLLTLYAKYLNAQKSCGVYQTIGMMYSWIRKTIVFLLLFLSHALNGQDRYMVFFTDKTGTPHTVEEPTSFLSARSLARRSLNNVSVIAQDLPVSPIYTNALKDLEIPVFQSSKWMNGILVQMDSYQYKKVSELSFVAHIEFVAPGAPLVVHQGAGAFAKAEQKVAQTGVEELDQLIFIDAQEMHRLGISGQGVWVAVFDDGFEAITSLPQLRHLFQQNRLADTFNFVTLRHQVENGFTHGLRVLSVMAADSEELPGIAPRANYALYVTETSGEYRIEEYNWLFAAERADSVGIDIINSSLGYTIFDDPTMSYALSDMDGETTIVTQAANWAAERGILVVNSAGNTGNSTWTSVVAPADSRKVLAVGALNNNRQPASFTSRGFERPNHFKPDVTSLGIGVKMVSSTGQFVFQNGTSFSAPAVSGLAIGLKQAFPKLTSDQLRNYIRQSGTLADQPDTIQGFGIPSFVRAMEAIVADQKVEDISFSAFPNPVTHDVLEVRLSDDLLGQQVELELWSSSGRLIQKVMERQILPEASIKLALKNQPSGLYLLRLITASGSTTKRIIK